MGVVKQAPDRGVLARLKEAELESTLEFQYNPTTLRRRKGARWNLQMPPGGLLPIPQFQSADPESLNFELLLDAREEPNRLAVRYQLAFLESMLVSQLGELDELLTQFQAPPFGLLTLGRRSWYVIVNNLDINEEMFDLELNPVRARVRVTMTGVFVGAEQQEQALLDLQDDALQADNVKAATETSYNTWST